MTWMALEEVSSFWFGTPVLPNSQGSASISYKRLELKDFGTAGTSVCHHIYAFVQSWRDVCAAAYTAASTFVQRSATSRALHLKHFAALCASRTAVRRCHSTRRPVEKSSIHNIGNVRRTLAIRTVSSNLSSQQSKHLCRRRATHFFLHFAPLSLFLQKRRKIKPKQLGHLSNNLVGKFRGHSSLEHRHRRLLAANSLRKSRLVQPFRFARLFELGAYLCCQILHSPPFLLVQIVWTFLRKMARVILSTVINRFITS